MILGRKRRRINADVAFRRAGFREFWGQFVLSAKNPNKTRLFLPPFFLD